MKFKLNKSEHFGFFNILKILDKTHLTIRENKTNNENSLIFFSYDNKLHIYVGNNIQACYFNLEIETEDSAVFSVDLNIFVNAFNNFPTDEVNFSFLEDKNSLIFGNKKSKVALQTSKVNNLEDIIKFIQTENANAPVNNLLDAIKYTSFSCSTLHDDDPYSEIMLSFSEQKFSAFSSDRHRISIYGTYNEENSYLLSKSFSDVIANFIKEFDNLYFYITKNSIVIGNNLFKLSTNIRKNTFEDLFKKMIAFKDQSKLEFTFTISKSMFLKSLKFIHAVANNDEIKLNFADNQILINGNNENKGMVADRISLNCDVPTMSVSYVHNQLVKALEVINSDAIECNILNYNDYYILNFTYADFSHLIFPMS